VTRPQPSPPRRLRRARGAGLLLGLALCGVACGDGVDRAELAPAPSASDGLLEYERNSIEVFRRVSGSVVYVSDTSVPRGGFRFDAEAVPRGAGSGFVWDDRGHIVTNYHVIHGGNEFSVALSDGSIYEAVLVGVEPRKDLAVLRIEASAPLQPIELGDSHGLVVGQKVLAIGNPFGLDNSLTTGVISALGREIESMAGTRIEDVIQTDASINPGSSGGPLLDSHGRVIGVTTAIFSTSGASAGIGFAVPSATIARLVPQLIENGRVKWASLGVQVLPDHIAAQWGVIGIIVRDVLPDSPAARAGLRPIQVDALGNPLAIDVITHIESRQVVRVIDLIDLLDDFEPGDTVKVRFERGDASHEVEIELGELS
jgi:protease Do-like 1, chloroplastic